MAIALGQEAGDAPAPTPAPPTLQAPPASSQITLTKYGSEPLPVTSTKKTAPETPTQNTPTKSSLEVPTTAAAAAAADNPFFNVISPKRRRELERQMLEQERLEQERKEEERREQLRKELQRQEQEIQERQRQQQDMIRQKQQEERQQRELVHQKQEEEKRKKQEEERAAAAAAAAAATVPVAPPRSTSQKAASPRTHVVPVISPRTTSLKQTVDSAAVEEKSSKVAETTPTTSLVRRGRREKPDAQKEQEDGDFEAFLRENAHLNPLNVSQEATKPIEETSASFARRSNLRINRMRQTFMAPGTSTPLAYSDPAALEQKTQRRVSRMRPQSMMVPSTFASTNETTLKLLQDFEGKKGAYQIDFFVRIAFCGFYTILRPSFMNINPP